MGNQHKEPMVGSGWGRALLGLFLFLILHGFLQFLAVIGLAPIMDLSVEELQNIAMNPQAEYYGIVSTALRTLSLISTLFIVYALCRWVDRRELMSLGLDIKGRWAQIRQGLIVGAGLIAAGFMSLYWMDYLVIAGISFAASDLFWALLLMILVSVSEELFFRGYLLKNLNESINKYAGLSITALIFAVMHMLNPAWTWISMLNIALAGMVLGVFYIHRENLWFPIALHFSWNFFQGPIAGFQVSGLKMESIVDIHVETTTWLTGGEFGFEGSVIASVLLILTFIWLDRTYATSK